MATVTIQLPSQQEQTRYNLERWAELLDDVELAKIEGRIETDRHGQIVMSPPPAPSHGRFQAAITHLLLKLLETGSVIPECPISTADGVKAADIAWVSTESLAQLGNRVCFARAPEICVEVLSPRNRQAEVQEKIALFFDAGAAEVWICSLQGDLHFFTSPTERASRSRICPKFPQSVVPR